MLVSLNLESGTVDQKTRFFNFMAALHTVATASAGSTPVVNPVSTNGVKNTDVNLITVLGNTEAGGWSTGVSNNITASTSYNANIGSPWVVDLYASTNKSSHPYYRLNFGNYSYTFGNNFVTYPGLQWIQGHTGNNPATMAYTSDTSTWNSSNFAIATGIKSMEGGITIPNHMLRVDVANVTTYIASTANYLIIWNNRSIVYWGLRDVEGWEINLTDNHPWCGFFYTLEPFGTSGGFMSSTSTYHSNYTIAWMRPINRSGAIQTAQKFGQYNNYVNSSGSSLTGLRNGTGTENVHRGPQSTYGNNWVSYKHLGPIFESLRSEWGAGTGYTSASYISPNDSPVTDPNTGLLVPPAYPVIFRGLDNQQQAVCKGQARGIYQGMITDNTGYATYVTANEYTIAGSTYIPAYTGMSAQPDLFFIRKA